MTTEHQDCLYCDQIEMCAARTGEECQNTQPETILPEDDPALVGLFSYQPDDPRSEFLGNAEECRAACTERDCWTDCNVQHCAGHPKFDYAFRDFEMSLGLAS